MLINITCLWQLFSKIKICWEEWHYFTFLQTSLISGLEDSLILISASTLVLWYVVLIEVYEDKLTSHRYVLGKGMGILIAFKDNCGYSLIST